MNNQKRIHAETWEAERSGYFFHALSSVMER